MPWGSCPLPHHLVCVEKFTLPYLTAVPPQCAHGATGTLPLRVYSRADAVLTYTRDPCRAPSFGLNLPPQPARPHARTGHDSRLELTYLNRSKRESFSGARENDSDVAVPDAWQGGGGKNLLPGLPGTGRARGD